MTLVGPGRGRGEAGPSALTGPTAHRSVVPDGPVRPLPALPAWAASSFSRAAVVVAVLGSWLVPPWIVLVAGLLAGLPHGAADHLVPRWWLGPRAPWMPVVVAGYAAAAVTAYLAFRAWPVAAVVLFLAVSAWHFVSGEIGFADLRAGRALAGRPVRSAGHLVAVLVLPVLLHPDGVLPLLRVVVDAPVVLAPGARTAVVVAAGIGLVVAALVIATDLATGRRAEAVDLGLLVLLAVLVHPLAAFGVYFGAWHSVRHLARTLVDDPDNARPLAEGRLGEALRRFARSAALPTLASLVFLGALVSVADGWQGFVSQYLALLAGLTVPHLVTVAWADRRRTAPGP